MKSQLIDRQNLSVILYLSIGFALTDLLLLAIHLYLQSCSIMLVAATSVVVVVFIVQPSHNYILLMRHHQNCQSATTIPQRHGNAIVPPPNLTSDQKNLWARINNSNRQIGLFFGAIVGTILGIILVLRDKVSIAIIGIPDSVVWDVFTVFLSAGTGANLCSFLGAWFDIVFGKWTIFDGMMSIYQMLKGEPQMQGPAPPPQN